MLSEDTQIIVNLVSGALLGLFAVLNIFALIMTKEVGKERRTGPYFVAYASFYVIIGILVLTFYLSPVEIRWWYLIGGFFGFELFVGAPFFLILEARLRRGSTLSDRENGSDA
jgi:hypothetical protein